jgi:hypothetical protein
MIPLFLRIIFFAVLLSGCAGYDRVLFVTKTNVGLDVDNKPPTAEITIARRELAISPTYQDTIENENTLPLLASFGLTGNFLNPEITSQFAGGDAALILAKGNDEKEQNNFSICLRKEPDTRPPWKKLWHLIFGRSKENTRAFYFATDTSFGLKVGWDGTGGPYPDNLKLGYNRKELAFPPIFVKEGCDPTKFQDQPKFTVKDGKTFQVDNNNELKLDGEGKPIPAEPWYEVKVPSFYASLDNSSTITEWTKSGTKHVQFFATGEAAKNFVKRESVLREAFNNMAPDAAELEANQLGLNQELIAEIDEKYEKTTDANEKTKIMQEALRLELVPDDTKNADLLDKLKEQSSSPLAEVSKKLNLLRRFANNPK